MTAKKITPEQALSRIQSIMRGVVSPEYVKAESKARAKKATGGTAKKPMANRTKKMYGGMPKKKG